jgi:ABC-2 type transport system permease protein
LSSAAVGKAAGGSVLYLCLIALMGLGVAAVARNAAFAAGIMLGLLYLVPAAMRFFPDPDWQETLYRLNPSTAGLAIQTTVDGAKLPIGPWTGLGVAAAWTLGSLLVGGWLLWRR